MGILFPNVKLQFFDDNGDPLAGGKLYSYIAGTTTPLATYSDNEVTPNTNPVILDADGRADVWLASSSVYKFRLDDSNDVTLWTVDNISGSGGGGGSSSAGGWRAQVEHAVTDGQTATDLTDETVDADDYSSAFYIAEIIRGTTVVSTFQFALHDLNGTWRLVTGASLSTTPHGVTLTISQTTTVAQLRAALDSGAGNGTIKLTRLLFAA